MMTHTPRALRAPDLVARSAAILCTAISATANVYDATSNFSDLPTQPLVAVAGVLAAHIATFVDYDADRPPHENVALLAIRLPALLWSVDCAAYVLHNSWMPGSGALAVLPSILIAAGGSMVQHWARLSAQA